MAIALEFLSLIVPIKLIHEKYPGGWTQCLEDHADLLGGCVWHDDHLFRTGAMSSTDIQTLVEEWAELGFEPIGKVKGKRVWKDCCVVVEMPPRATLPCSWIEITGDGHAVYLKGTEPGTVVGRS